MKVVVGAERAAADQRDIGVEHLHEHGRIAWLRGHLAAGGADAGEVGRARRARILPGIAGLQAVAAPPADLVLAGIGRILLQVGEDDAAVGPEIELARLHLRPDEQVVDVGLGDRLGRELAAAAHARRIVGDVQRELADAHLGGDIVGQLGAGERHGEEDRQDERELEQREAALVVAKPRCGAGQVLDHHAGQFFTVAVA